MIYWRDHWILVDPQDMESLRPIFDKPLGTNNAMGSHGTISYSEALKLGMIGKVGFQDLGPTFDVRLEGDFSNIIERLSHIDSFPEIQPPTTFNGTLRPYQQKGLTWLTHMTSFNFGIILADDMGLGKTIQVIAFLLYRKIIVPTVSGATLIICPTSVIFNWQRELQKFGPDLEVRLHYGPDRVKDFKEIRELMIPHRIILTTYGMIRNDIEFLQTVMFSGIIVDESQNIKNVKTQQTQAIYKLKGQYRICLSGTPIENRLLELWSLFEFLNPGLLGLRKDFQTQFILPIERFHDEDIINKLRKFISPFILRRLKSDKSIIQNLPAKNEMKVYLQLTPIQAQLYQKAVQETMQQIENKESSTIRQRGLILKLLMQLKQICNHPYQFLHLPLHSFDPESQFPEDAEETLSNGINQTKEVITKLDTFIDESSKVERLLEMVEEVLENGQKLLIFTQFKQMGDLLQKVFETKYNIPVLFLHGQVAEKKRREMVDEFQSPEPDSPPIMLLSLKAGGLGLNLTQASTVFHFDRWWNPAVENQATDRAYRIGQTQQVNVYKFIMNGTIEEKIDAILEEKRSIADQIVATGGETWITQLSNEELRELFALGKSSGRN